MKKITFLLVLFGLVSISFQKNEGLTNENEALKHLQVKITGMTCEIGCARTIESKISKMKGVKYASVSYAKSIGQFTYDSKITSSSEIIKKINGIGGGKLYKVVESKEVIKFN